MKFESSALKNAVKTDIREYCEKLSVHVAEADNGRFVIEAWNEAGHNGVEVDLLDVLEWVRVNRPELLKEVCSRGGVS